MNTKSSYTSNIYQTISNHAYNILLVRLPLQGLVFPGVPLRMCGVGRGNGRDQIVTTLYGTLSPWGRKPWLGKPWGLRHETIDFLVNLWLIYG